MLAHDRRARPCPRFLFAAAGVLLGLCSCSGCDDKPGASDGGAAVSRSPVNPDGAGPAKHKRTPRAPK